MTGEDTIYALIYSRVSSAKQKTLGHGLDSQEMRCRQFAEANGYVVEAVFPDDASGGGDFMNRPGMVALLAYVDAQRSKNKNKTYVVIFDDLKRFARDTEFHIALRRAFKKRGARIECLNFKFEDTPEGEFIETIIAAQGQLEREQNRRQVTQKMQARVGQGYWCFAPAVGYKYEKVEGHGKMLVRNEPLASIVAEGLRGFASGRLESPAEVKRFFESHAVFPRDRYGDVRFQRVNEILKRPIYAGLIDVPEWGISLQPGKHEPLIDSVAWSRIQDRLAGPAKAPARKDLNEDFPLRGFVTCGCCGEPFTACWSAGRNAKYPYYMCDTRGCPEYRKSFRREHVEGEFEVLLTHMVPEPDLFLMVYKMLEDLWGHLQGLTGKSLASTRQELQMIERKTEQIMERLVEADSPALIAAYENQIRKLELRKRAAEEEMSRSERPTASFKETYRTAMEFFANPWKLWSSERLADKRLVLRMAFKSRLGYFRNEGYRTAETTLPFKLLTAILPQKEGLVEPIGIEPTTS